MTSPMTYDATLIRELLDHQGRSGEWLADRTGYSREHVSRVLNAVHPVTEKFAVAAAAAFDVPVSWFATAEVAA